MIRVMKLLLLGIAIAASIWAYAHYRGGLAAAIGVGIKIDVKVTQDGVASRHTRIYGPSVLVKAIPEILELQNGSWRIERESKKTEDIALTMHQEFSDKMKPWNLSRSEVKVTTSNLRKKVLYKEVAEAGMESSRSSLEFFEHRERGSVGEEFKSTLRETENRMRTAVLDFLGSAQLDLTIEMPDDIIECSPSLKKKSSRIAHFRGTPRTLAELGEIYAVSRSTTSRWLGKILGICLLIISIGLGFFVLWWWWRCHIARR